MPIAILLRFIRIRIGVDRIVRQDHLGFIAGCIAEKRFDDVAADSRCFVNNDHHFRSMKALRIFRHIRRDADGIMLIGDLDQRFAKLAFAIKCGMFCLLANFAPQIPAHLRM